MSNDRVIEQRATDQPIDDSLQAKTKKPSPTCVGEGFIFIKLRAWQ
jgi:hypothetical protein